MYKEPNNIPKDSKMKRVLKVDDKVQSSKNFTDIDAMLKTISKNFMSEPVSLESLNKQYNEIIDKKVIKASDQSKTKQKGEKAIFYDIFIKPKEVKINEIRNKRIQEKKEKDEMNRKKLDLNDPSTVMASNSKKIKSFFTGKMKGFLSKIKKGEVEQDVDNVFGKTVTELNLDSKILFNYLSSKFAPAIEGNNKGNFFNQLIQIKPPEGINAIVASPLMESKGWAPSIPSMQIKKTKTSLSDLMLRAKGGIQAGDIPKEAHMAFYLGVLNEDEKNYGEALKFYKKYFLSAKLLQDIYGTELALNRIGVLYSNIDDYEQSLYYNEKHKEITTHNINGFVAYFNSGICHRMIGNIKDSLDNFQKALEYAHDESDLEAYVLCLAQMSISFLFDGNIARFKEFSNEFFDKNSELKHDEMEMEMLMVAGFVYNFIGDDNMATHYYQKAYEKAKLMSKDFYKACCLSNLGVLEAGREVDNLFEMLEYNNLNMENEIGIENDENYDENNESYIENDI